MTSEDKKKRRDRIARVAEARSENKPATFWLTRNLVDGVLDERVTVWLLAPVFRRYESNVFWELPEGCVHLRVSTTDGPKPGLYTTWTTDQCERTCRVYPDDERQCIHVGEDPPVLWTD